MLWWYMGWTDLDEISITAPTQIAEVVDGKIKSYLLDPTEYGFHYKRPGKLH